MIGKLAPDFEANYVKAGEIQKEPLKLSEIYKNGKWVILFFYPADFTFVCPTEVEGFADKYTEFQEMNAEVISVSTDTVFTHKAWIEHDKRVSKAKYPMVEDRTGNISKAYGVYDEKTGNAHRGLFIIDPKGIIKYMVITDDNVGRSTEETKRVLAALQSGGLCPVDWEPGEPTLKI